MKYGQDLFLALRQFKRAYDEAFHGVMARYALTRNEVDVILFLANQPGHGTARDIVELRGMTKSHVCQSIESLTARGWLSGAQDPADRRVVRLTLEPEAMEAVEAARSRQSSFFARLNRGVTEAERQTVAGVFQKMRENIKGDEDDA